MLGLKPMEILLIMAVLLLLFGASRLPQLGSALGSAIRNFKRGFSADEPSDAPGNEAKPPAALSDRGAPGDAASPTSQDREREKRSSS